MKKERRDWRRSLKEDKLGEKYADRREGRKEKAGGHGARKRGSAKEEKSKPWPMILFAKRRLCPSGGHHVPGHILQDHQHLALPVADGAGHGEREPGSPRSASAGTAGRQQK